MNIYCRNKFRKKGDRLSKIRDRTYLEMKYFKTDYLSMFEL